MVRPTDGSNLRCSPAGRPLQTRLGYEGLDRQFLHGNAATLDISYDGRRVIFGTAASPTCCGMDGDGQKPHLILSSTPVGDMAPTSDRGAQQRRQGRRVHDQLAEAEVSVIGFDAIGRKAIIKDPCPPQPIALEQNLPLFLTADGKRLDFSARLFDVAGGTNFEILRSFQRPGRSSTRSMRGRRGCHRSPFRVLHERPKVFGRAQLATAELNAPSAGAAAARRQRPVDPPWIPKTGDFCSTIKAAVTRRQR
jgi:hypothetical protein